LITSITLSVLPFTQTLTIIIIAIISIISILTFILPFVLPICIFIILIFILILTIIEAHVLHINTNLSIASSTSSITWKLGLVVGEQSRLQALTDHLIHHTIALFRYVLVVKCVYVGVNVNVVDVSIQAQLHLLHLLQKCLLL